MNVVIDILTILFGTAVLSFVQFLIIRSDNRKDHNAAILKKIEELEQKIDRIEATNSRRRILEYSQEVRRGVRHTEEEWNQINQEIDVYNKYCTMHPDYENNRAVMAIKNLNAVYEKCLMTNDFDVTEG